MQRCIDEHACQNDDTHTQSETYRARLAETRALAAGAERRFAQERRQLEREQARALREARVSDGRENALYGVREALLLYGDTLGIKRI